MSMSRIYPLLVSHVHNDYGRESFRFYLYNCVRACVRVFERVWCFFNFYFFYCLFVSAAIAVLRIEKQNEKKVPKTLTTKSQTHDISTAGTHNTMYIHGCLQFILHVYIVPIYVYGPKYVCPSVYYTNVYKYYIMYTQHITTFCAWNIIM